jgi:hypothetical protein
VLAVAGAFRASRSLPFLTSEASDAGREQRFFVPQNDGLGEPAKWHERTVAIKSSEILLREAHPFAALSLFSAPLR